MGIRSCVDSELWGFGPTCIDGQPHRFASASLQRIFRLREDEGTFVRTLLRVTLVRNDAVSFAHPEHIPILVEGQTEHLALNHHRGCAAGSFAIIHRLLEVVGPAARAIRLWDAEEDVVFQPTIGARSEGVSLAWVHVVLGAVAEHFVPLSLEVRWLERGSHWWRIRIEFRRVLLHARAHALLLFEGAAQP